MSRTTLSGTDLSEDLVQKVQAALSKWNDPSSDARKRFDQGRKRRQERVLAIEKVVADSKRLTVEDLSMQINAVD